MVAGFERLALVVGDPDPEAEAAERAEAATEDPKADRDRSLQISSRMCRDIC